jgi:hypothetical protein
VALLGTEAPRGSEVLRGNEAPDGIGAESVHDVCRIAARLHTVATYMEVRNFLTLSPRSGA